MSNLWFSCIQKDVKAVSDRNTATGQISPEIEYPKKVHFFTLSFAYLNVIVFKNVIPHYLARDLYFDVRDNVFVYFKGHKCYEGTEIDQNYDSGKKVSWACSFTSAFLYLKNTRTLKYYIS